MGVSENGTASLLVPMNVTALCVSPADVSNQDGRAVFGHVAMDFNKLPKPSDTLEQPYSSKPVLPEAFVTTAMTAGIRLHWALPDALTRGDVSVAEADKGKVNCPPAPNRFLVVRIAFSENGEKRSVDSWVVEGDYRWGEGEDRKGRNQHSRAVPLTPDLTYQESKPTHAFQGRSVRYADWQETHPNPDPSSHTALGYGNESYAAAYPHGPNVFGFFDPFDPGGNQVDDGLDSRTTNDSPCFLSYLVIGWHSDSKCDPITRLKLALAGKPTQPEKVLTFAEALESNYRWSYNPTGEEPVQTLYVGQLTSLEWNPKHQYLAKSAGETVAVLAGTTAEALSAVLAHTLKQNLAGTSREISDEDAANIETILNQLQFDLLDRYKSHDGVPSLQDAQHERAFTRVNAGHGNTKDSGQIWTINRAAAKRTVEDVAPKPLPVGVADALSKLNQLQAEYDNLAAELATRRAQLFVDWAKYMEAKYTDLYPEIDSIQDLIQAEIEDIEALSGPDGLGGKLSIAYQQLCGKRDFLVQLLNLQDQYLLESSSAPRFYEPSDPVILLSGPDVNPSYRYGGDGRCDGARGNLACRLSSEITRGMTVGNRTLTAQDLPLQLQANQNQHNGSEFAALVTETLFLDYNQAILLASKAGGLVTAGQIQSAQYDHVAAKISGPLVPLRRPNAGPNTNQPLNSPTPTFSGVGPSPVGFVLFEQPWIPLFLQWEATYNPIYPTLLASKSRKYDENWVMDNFQLHGFHPDDQAPDTTYLGQPQADAKPEMKHRGAVTLANNAEINLAAKIKAYLENHPDSADDSRADQQMKQTLKALSEVRLSMMAQAMGGFHRQLLLRKQTIQLPVFDMWADGDNAKNLAKRAKGAVGLGNDTVGLTDRLFNPVRAGTLQLNDLWLVDAFGQVRKLNLVGKNVILADALKDPSNKKAQSALLPLRITQPARLSFRYCSATVSDVVAMNRNPDSSPVFGWVLFNRLDNALAIYSAEGTAIGSFALNGPGWQGAPGVDGMFGKTIVESFKDANPYLRDFALNLGGGPPLDPGAQSYEADLEGFRDRFLKDFIDAIDLGAMGILPDSYGQDQGLSLLIGRPLALVRAELRLDLYGMPALNQRPDAFMDRVNGTGGDGTASFAQVRFPVRLGETIRANDGLVGYFIGKTPDAYKTFYAPSAPENGKRQVVAPPSKGRERLSLAPADKDTKTVTMLVDPRAPIHASTGILPVKSIAIAPAQFADALRSIAVTFLSAPVLSSGERTAVAVPSEVGHAWSWLTLQTSPLNRDKREWRTQEIVAPPNTRAAFAAPPRLTEGWLRLYPAETSSKPPNPG
jgi:hypothetical protein